MKKKHRTLNPCNLLWLREGRPPAYPKHPKGTVRMADLFCGCGGLSLGIIEACRMRELSVRIVLAVDTDKSSLKVYTKNMGTACLQGRASRIEDLFQGNLDAELSSEEKRLAKSIGRLDLLVAGPPCQGHSDLNNHSRRLDPRNALYARVSRAARLLKPQVVIIENVTGVTRDRGRVLARTEKLLISCGYETKSVLIDAKMVGIPQRRRRHFLVAFLPERPETEGTNKRNKWKSLPEFRGPHWVIKDVLGGLEDEPERSKDMFRTSSQCSKVNLERIAYLFKTRSYDLPNSQRPPCHKDSDHTYKAVYGRLKWDGISNTITGGFGSMGQGRYIHPMRRRLITPHEAARLQGFPDWFDFTPAASRGSLQQMIGNAVVPKVSAWLTSHLLDTGLLKPGASEIAPQNKINGSSHLTAQMRG